MTIDTVIFDMDGVLIDSEPCWEEAGRETLQHFGVTLSLSDYSATTGLRTREWIEWWFRHFNIDQKFAAKAEETIVTKAIEKIREEGKAMPGVEHIFQFFKERNFNIGLATSSPVALIKVVTEKLGIKEFLDGFSSAEDLVNSKPHPEVYLDCAKNLDVSPLRCICFEDSVNGMIAAKAARMKCVVIPVGYQQEDKRFGLADLQLKSLHDFTEFHLDALA